MRPEQRRWFLREPSADARMLLLLMPYSGCGASMYRSWPAAIGDAEVVPLQLPWRENRMREPHFGTYQELAESLLDDVGELLTARPYALFGHCGGALPAFETVIEIARRGLPAPQRYFVSSQVAPQDGPWGRFLGLSEQGLRDEIAGLLHAMGAAAAADELVDLFIDVMEADLEANRKYYRPAGSVPCPITALGWSEDVEVPHGLMGGWQEWAATEKLVLPGTHYTFLEAPPALLEALAPRLRTDSASGSGSGSASGCPEPESAG
ncbi:thioesterase II family protein [Streptomyces violens]|uniref:thioesterase II family protein n=1 Tax=Streptomyces violens TaxID=66377 RepID=UPI0007C766DA|nr:thioesterase domain-containing protein [Streptomyces violens]